MSIRHIVRNSALLAAMCFATIAVQAQPLSLDRNAEFIMAVGELKEITLPRIWHSNQGLAVQGRYAFFLYHYGACVAVDLEQKSFISEFEIDGAKRTHCNNASWGVQRASADAQFPLLYVSECGGEHRCFVEDISLTGCRKVQTLRYTGKGYSNAFDWCIDRENGYIYTYGNTPQRTILINRFRLPDAFVGDVTLTEDDVLWSVENKSIKVYQGSAIWGNTMFCPDGTYPIHRLMRILDMRTGEESECFDLSHLLYEPEGVCVSDGYLYLVFNSTRGRLYRFKLTNK